jgi:phosphatidylserine decarboxylase
MFHREGYVIIACTLGGCGISAGAVHYWMGSSTWVSWLIYGLLLTGLVLILQFFRNPSRHTVLQDKGVIAPADGKVVIIGKVFEPEYFQGERLQISIFMSPFNVHVNRNPVSGVVSYFKYHPGDYLVAWHPKSSTLNERTTVVVRNKKGHEILLRQIAGALARRIRWYINAGDTVLQGSEFGFIRFGSRVDLYLPLNAVPSVEIGQKVRGGETCIASLQDES